MTLSGGDTNTILRFWQNETLFSLGEVKRRGTVNTSRKTARIVGVIYMIGILSGMTRYFLLTPILEAPDYLIQVSANETRVIFGTLFFFVSAFMIAGVAVVMYPILRKYNEALSLGFVAARLADGILIILAILAILTLLTLSMEFVETGTPDTPYYQTTGDLLLALHHWAYDVWWAIIISLSSLMFFYLLYQSRLVPRWLSVWGLLGAILFPLGSVSLFGSPNSVFVLPLVVSEWTLIVWLIVKGFNPSANVSEPAEAETAEIKRAHLE
jgi:hypothetical protein